MSVDDELAFWNRCLDRLKETRCDPATDVQLSFLIRVSPAMISQLRTGRRSFPFPLKIKVLDALGYVIDHDLLVRLLPRADRLALLELQKTKVGSKSARVSASENKGLELPPLT